MGGLDVLSLAFALIVLGFVLMGAELLLPSGVFAVISLVTVIVGVSLSFTENAGTGLITLAAVVVIFPILGGLFVRVWPKTWLGKKLFLAPVAEATAFQTAGSQALDQLIGRFGRTLCELRPAGVASFDGQRVEVITEGLLVAVDQWVRCVEVRAGRVVVRPVEKPDLGRLETADF
jgi:membrane-bound serine protease (ClpP class)